MSFFGFHRRPREHERNEREWDENRTRDWGERRYQAGQNERWGQRGDIDDQRYGANPYERPEEFGQNRGDWYTNPREMQRDYGLGSRRPPRDRWQESYGPQSGSDRTSYRGAATEQRYADVYRGRDEGTHGAYGSPDRTDFDDFGRGARGGEMSTYGAGQFRGRGPKGYRRSDERIREDVCECLTEDDRIDATNVEVQVKDCEVTLTGTVNSRMEKRRAEDLIDALPGVRDVNNNLRVVNEGGMLEGSSPSRQTSQSPQQKEQGSRH